MKQENKSLQETITQFRDQIIAAVDAEDEEETASQRLIIANTELRRLEREVQYQTQAREKLQEEVDIAKENEGVHTCLSSLHVCSV